MKHRQTTQPGACASCGAELLGKFCHQCGEKQLHPQHDFSVLHFLEETFESFTHLDSRVLRSFKYLFVRPGFLTAEFINGRRVRYLKPIPLFLIAGVLFYLFFSSATAFYSNINDMHRGYAENNVLSNTFHVNTAGILQHKAAAAQQSEEAYWKEMSVHASQKSKTWLFLIAPVWGIFLWLLFRSRMPWLVPHLIFALHGLSFFVLSDMLLLTLFSKVLGYRQLGDWYSALLIFTFSIYCTLAIRRVYGLGKLRSVAYGLGSMAIFLIVLIVYRQLITTWTLVS